MSGPLYELALSVPWCCTSEALEAMLAIAARDPLPEDETQRRMHGPRSLALRGGQRREDSGRMTMQGPVAVIPIDGPIFRYADMFTRYSGGITTEGLARDLQTALDDPAVAGILLAIDSPGGESTGINELADLIYRARGRKPLAAYIEGYGASAAYWIASAAETVIVDDTALVGSIGTILGVPDPTKRPSARIDIVSSQSPKKRPDVTTPEGRAVLQQMADDMTAVFIAKVAEYRDLDPAQILAIEGGMLIGQQAIDAGLADMLGSEQRALEALASQSLPLSTAARRQRRRMHNGGSAAVTEETSPMPPEKTSFWTSFWQGAREAGLAPEHETALGAQLAAAAPAPQAAAPLAVDPRVTQASEENAKLRAELSRLQRERITADADTFVKGHLAAGRALPAERESLTALYTALACQEAGIGLETGSSPLGLFRAALDARPANRLAEQVLPNALPMGAAVLPNTTGGAALIDEAERSARAYAKQANGGR